MKPLLEVSDLHVHAEGKPIVDGVDFQLQHGEALGLAGESGCGKTTTALALMKLLPGGLDQSGTMTLNLKGADEPINLERPNQPVTRFGSAGLPTSMYRCASKCERELLRLPVAWVTSSSPAWNAGTRAAIACGNAKKLSSAIPFVGAVESGRGIAIDVRDV